MYEFDAVSKCPVQLVVHAIPFTPPQLKQPDDPGGQLANMSAETIARRKKIILILMFSPIIPLDERNKKDEWRMLISTVEIHLKRNTPGP